MIFLLSASDVVIPEASGYTHYHNYDDLAKLFCDLLQRISEKYPGFPIILHGIHEFHDMYGTKCEWLPVPSKELNVRYIVSFVPAYNDYETFKDKFDFVLMEHELPGLDIASRKMFVSSYFSRFNKILDGEQIDVLVSQDGSSSPLWLSLACEEIRMFGIYENLTSFITELPGNIMIHSFRN